jgi:hypothetical protein
MILDVDCIAVYKYGLSPRALAQLRDTHISTLVPRGLVATLEGPLWSRKGGGSRQQLVNMQTIIINTFQVRSVAEQLQLRP